MDKRIGRESLFLNIAHLISLRGTCTRNNVGCVITSNDGRIISTGYTGSPSGLPHCIDEGCIISPTTGGCIRTVHAEQGAITYAAKHGIKLEGSILYTTLSPCIDCAKAIIGAGIKKVIYLNKYRDETGLQYLQSSGIIIKEGVILKDESQNKEKESQQTLLPLWTE